jgi:hypothetical protein
MASLFVWPYISPHNVDTAEFPSKKEILLAQMNAVNEYEQIQLDKATNRRVESLQQVDAGGMRMIQCTMGSRPCSKATATQLRLCMEAQCRSAGHRA